ncbi:MAG: ribonuclease D, partial [Gammaproteobacteria bacterium]|nr:ribonuclease D [Gammaproteobacteria bacterium]
MTTSKHLIDSQPQLDALCDSLADTAGDSIACDTEFVRTQTYWPQLCLIQLALDGQHVAVDVLADLDTTRLQRQLLERPDREIFHAAKQDMEAFYSVYEQLPQVIFDTQ